jgi:hypothetical protein
MICWVYGSTARALHGLHVTNLANRLHPLQRSRNSRKHTRSTP